MTDVTVELGSIAFAGMEIPTVMPWGGDQAHNVHKLLGGQRVIDALGPDDMEIAWSGRFQGANAMDRATALDQMRRDGQQQTLTWGPLSYQVLVIHFRADFERLYQQPYSISCLVISAAAQSPTTSNATLDDLVGGDMDQVNTQVSAITDPTVLPAITSLNGAIAAVGTLQGASLSALAPLATAAANASSVLSTAIGNCDSLIQSGVGTVAGVVAGSFPPTIVSMFNGQVAAITQQSSLLQVRALVNRVQKNIAQATG